MKRNTGILIVASLALLAFLAPRGAQAYSFDLGAANFGGYTGPYVNVDIQLTSGTTADVTFTSLTNGGFSFLLVDGGSAALNVNASGASAISVSALVATSAGVGFNTATLTAVVDINNSPPPPDQVDGWGRFNLIINSSGSFGDASKKITFTITRTGGTWANAADVLSPNADGYAAASHVAVCSGNLTDDPCVQADGAALTGFVSTPEPGSVAVFSIGLLVAGGLIRRLGRKA